LLVVEVVVQVPLLLINNMQEVAEQGVIAQQPSPV
jgi:hypothetical protein